MKTIPQELKNSFYFKRILKFCSSNIKSESEVRKKLRDIETPDDLFDEIINTLLELKFCFSDTEYVSRFLENISSVKGYSKIQLKNKLLRKGIPSKIIDSSLNDYYKINEEIEVEKFVEKNLRKLTRKPKEKRLYFLLSKGFRVDKSKKMLLKFDL